MPATPGQAVPLVTDRSRRPPLAFGPFTFDPNSRLLRRGGDEIPLPPRVLGVLEILLARAGDVVPRLELMDTVWKDAFVTDTSLAEAVSVLRQALDDDPQAPTYIQTVHRRGYRFVAPVSSAAPGPTPSEAPAVAEVKVSPSIGGQLAPWSIAVLCALAAGAAIWQLTHGRQREPSAVRFEIATASGTYFDDRAPALALAPDGSHMAWAACDASGCRLVVRPLDRLEVRTLPGTDGAQSPFFSPDGRWLAFFADGRLQKVALSGGAPVRLADAAQPLGGVWIDREIVFAGSPGGGLMRVPAVGGEARALTTPRESDGEVRHAWPAQSPDGSVLLFTIEMTADDRAPAAIGAMSIADGMRERPWRTLVSGGAMARAAAPDTIVFSRGNELQAIAFDPTRLETAGEARTVVSGVAPARSGAQFALSSTGSLMYAHAQSSAGATGLAWWSATEQRDMPDETRHLRAARLAPDGGRVTGVKVDGTRADIWAADVGRGAATRLTHAGVNSSPIWSADGRTVFFATRTNGVFEIWRRDAEGINPAARVYASSRHALPLAAAPDGSALAFLQTGDGTRADIWSLPLTEAPPRPFVQGPFDDSAAAYSPDAKLCAYQSAESGRTEIHVQRVRDGRRVVVSADGGERPLWTRDGLYYQSGGRLMRATIVENAGDLRISGIDVITHGLGGTLAGVAPDGRVLIDRGVATRPSSAVMSIEWIREVRQLLGPPPSALPR